MLKIYFPKILRRNVTFSFILYHEPFFLFVFVNVQLFILFFTLLDVAQYSER